MILFNIIQKKFLILFSVILPIFFSGCTFSKQEVNLSHYHINTEYTANYLVNEKMIISYNPTEYTLNKTTFYKTSKEKLVQHNETIYPIESDFIFGQYGMRYYHDLYILGCDYTNVSECIKKNITNKYIIQNNQKSYIIDKTFGTKIFNIIEEYKVYLNNSDD